MKLLVPRGLHISNEHDRTTVGKLIKNSYTESSFCENILAGIKVKKNLIKCKLLTDGCFFLMLIVPFRPGFY